MNSQAIIDLNRQQTVSEVDSFTASRYLTFLKHFRPGTVDVLDVGCNTGRGGTAIKRREPRLRIIGMDCVPPRLRKLDETIYISSVCGFAHQIPLPGNAFDAIVAGEVIEHIPPQLVFPSLCEFFRVLRLRGRLVLTTPNPYYIRNRVQGLSVLLSPSHVSQHTPSSLSRRLEDVGFSGIKIRGCGRVSKILGAHFPFRSAYGSYLIVAEKW